MSGFRPGVLPNNPSKPRLSLAHFLTGAPIVPPAAVDWDRVVKSWPMDANDQYGDCVWAMIGHTIQTWTANASTEVDVPVAALLKGYTDVTGFNPADPSTDRGTVIQDALSYWRKAGVAGHRIVAFAEVDHTNVTEMEAAAALFGEVLFGIDFPASAMDQFDAGQPWDVVPGAKIEGGHAVCSARYDSASQTPWTVITWGREQPVTAAFLGKYLTEAWVAVSQEWVEANGVAPSGLDLHALGVAFAGLTGEPNPFPGPTPPSPPQPPADPDHAFASVLHPWILEHHTAVGGNSTVAKAAKTWLAAKSL